MQFHSPRDRIEIKVWPWLLAAGVPVVVLLVLAAYYVNRSQVAGRLPTLPARPPVSKGLGIRD